MTAEFPGFVDIHVHFRDPGVPEAETTASGLAAAMRGGFAAVVTMPNTSPACDSAERIAYQRRRTEESGSPVRLFPSACITKGRLGAEVADLESLAEAGAAFFTDDGSYVADDRVMEEAMGRSARLGLAVCDHAMDPKMLSGGVIRDCPLARRLGLKIIPAETETAAIRRDLSICRVTGCRLHIQHISTAEGVDLVRSAQKEGLPVSAEATPHHLLFACEDIPSNDAAYKMAPPLGAREDRAELRKAVKEGVLMFATDHAPHPARTKSAGFAKSANGIIGLETAVPVTWRVMVEEEGMNPEAWARAWWKMPRGVFGKEVPALAKTVVETGSAFKIDLSSFASLSRNCPYGGMEFDCRAKLKVD
ncbi:MAG: dihydroorotase [Kiritimatiellae bacterium]|nr:dihydroorotase [Kiritimatiellia bacterium]